jgi:inner membrane protein
MNLFEYFMDPKFLWLVLGLLLCIIEITIPGLVIIFFGLGAISVGVMCFIAPISLNYQLLIFICSSVFYLVMFRRWFKTLFFKSKESAAVAVDAEFVGKQAKVTQKVEPGRVGKVELHGTVWEAVSKDVVPEGEMVMVIDKKNITLEVESL